MKIAFASCMDALDDPKQTVWDDVLAHAPDVLLLLGDNIYTDYSYKWLGSSHALHRPEKWDPQRFAAELYLRYLAQSKVDRFRALVGSVPRIGVIWDDHDFAWNGAHGSGTGDDHASRNRTRRVSEDRKKISRAMFLQFKEWMNGKPLAAHYPSMPSFQGMLGQADAANGIEDAFDFGGVRFILTDGRWYREEKKPDKSTSILGDSQKLWLKQQLNWPGIKIICSGTTLNIMSEAWSHYDDYSWLKRECGGQELLSETIFLSGDVHYNTFRRHKLPGNVHEVVSSGSARPHAFGVVGNYGVLTISGGQALAELYGKQGPKRQPGKLVRRVL